MRSIGGASIQSAHRLGILPLVEALMSKPLLVSKPSLVVVVLTSWIVVGVTLNSEPLNAQGSKTGDKAKVKSPDDGLPFVKTCKAATGLVNRQEFGSGSAFCISTEGFFLTNRHVVEGLDPGESVDVVMNAGEKTEKILKAKLVHVSEEERVDLAILKTAASKELTALSLGDDSKLQETAAVTAFGFPFGRSLAAAKSKFPNVTVTSGRISALRRNDDVLEAIQVDAAINPGCSGGPLVDRQGKVVGVVFAAIPLSGIAFAVPVSRVKDYIKAPHLMVSLPKVRYSERHSKQRIGIEVVELTPSTKPVAMELTLQGEDAKPRTVPLQRNGAAFEALVELFDKPAVTPPLTLKVWRGKALTTVQVPDQSVQFGAKRLMLSECRLVQRRPEAHLITTLDGEKFAASTTDLPQVKSDGGELDLKLANRIQIFSSDAEDAEVTLEAVANRDGKPIATATAQIRCVGRPRHGAGEFLADPDPDELPPDGLTIEAFIDNRSSLIVTPSGLFWENHEGTLPGCPDGSRSAVLVNGRKWPLEWERDFNGNTVSDRLPLKLGTTLYDVKLLSLRDRPDGPHNPQRGSMSLSHQSNAGEALRISIKDTAPGAGHFRIHLRPTSKWSIPEPVAPRLKPPTSARWTFDDDRSDRIQDATGNQHVGHGPFPTIVPGKIGNSLALDVGSVNCGNIGDFEKNDAFSLGGWAWINNGTVFNNVCSRMDGRVGFRGYDLGIDGDKLGFQLFHDAHARNGLSVRSAELLKTFRWYHVFATYDGSGNTSGIRLYIDGAPAEFVAQIDALTETTRLNVPFRIGHREIDSPNPEP
ncbi:MAG: trypsin-like peptidase domain-containing protein, partial [Planctomycetaceae bacterium]|nr:trypsin-like peptidase domain-containing protein [Planctomycetaceae bacterium]